MAARHQQAGEVAFLLEPDLKEARGGLREQFDDADFLARFNAVGRAALRQLKALTPPQEGPALSPTGRHRATGGRFVGGGGAEPILQDRGQAPKPFM